MLGADTSIRTTNGVRGPTGCTVDQSSYYAYFARMKAVGIKASKNNRSRFLKEVQAGESIWVTDREQIIAEIRKPTSPVAEHTDRWEAFLNAAAIESHRISYALGGTLDSRTQSALLVAYG